ncbi:MAG: hypothetical protein A2639_00465 [Candidatus Staskawiczbacteria bacterium RIFCSPHIGHO2_01_FULL_34_27]|uniref:Methyltransferase small domain-containing protein n=1 Tax=Candidatus Staskawiczbacteria bacterium RIFCSPHIGHO2_01_FULL_34_27 TaxID=1802199 RepID=A0A1G2HJB0_9BACT|nr:methyltransferase [Candidatus Pacearchaeota archaeon]OGZ62543.1 MAG: hypothetical protein A2639_00465 [Candidatus Staskawiczbacteria bacterium RIFCSPHIGHO2_01_FULL_34_27]
MQETSIYIPSEDSFLLSKVLEEKLLLLLKKNPKLKFLEIGVGSGVQLKTAKKLHVKNIFGVDINPKAVNECKKLGFDVIKSDLLSNVKGKYDLIIFNPPYLPIYNKEPKSSRISTTGGKKGDEIILRFLKKLKNHLTKNGKAFLVLSSLTPKSKINLELKKQNFKKKIVSKENLFFENLFVLEIKISP